MKVPGPRHDNAFHDREADSRATTLDPQKMAHDARSTGERSQNSLDAGVYSDALAA